MKKLILSGLTVAILFIASPLGHLNAQTPIIQTKFTADPAPMVHKGMVYLYTTHDEDSAPEGMAGFRMKEWLLYTSTDMVNWTDHGTIADLYNFKWADPAVSGWGGFENGAWAPQCIERNGKFYLYCPVQGRGIGVLVADSPLGPFTDPLGKPLIGAEYDSIDPSVLIDDDGQAYLYWGNPNLWYVKLNEDMISCAGEITKDKQIRKIENQKDPYHFQEGPWAYKKNGHYYMAYASTCCPEGIGYAMGPGPVGPWEFKGYIMKPNGKSSGNHPGIIDYKGKSYVFGFNYRLNFMITDKHHERRSICVAEMEYNPDGTIKELPWWDDGVGEDAPGSMPHAEMELEEFAAAIPDGQLDFIVFEACLMAGVEVAYVLRGKTDYILSSAAEIVSPGFTPIYPSALRYLFDTSRSVEASLAAFGESYMSHVNKLSGDSRSATLSLVATKELDLLAARTRELLAGLSHRPDIISDLQHFDRPGSYGDSPAVARYFDLGDWARRIGAQEQYTVFEEQLKRIVRMKASTERFLPSQNGFEIRNHSGLTTYAERSELPALNAYYRTTAWYKAILGNN